MDTVGESARLRSHRWNSAFLITGHSVLFGGCGLFAFGFAIAAALCVEYDDDEVACFGGGGSIGFFHPVPVP